MHKELYLSTLHDVSHLILKITPSSALLFSPVYREEHKYQNSQLLKVTGHSHITLDAMLITVMFLYIREEIKLKKTYFVAMNIHLVEY